MVLKILVSCMFLCISLLMLWQMVVRIKEAQYDANRFKEKVKGKVIDYKKQRHSLANSKDKRILYHPVIKYKKDGEEYNGVSEVGYNREYYKVGNIITVYCDMINPNRIKTKGERTSIKSVIVFMLLSILSFISAAITLFV